MSRILILEPQVAAQIAAGEVITRPGAAVKELVENALDAGARTISVEVAEGGKQFLKVVDDGCGMTPAEAELSLKRHATSKLRSETDLLHLITLGFRGEALPSIAAVSRFSLITRPPEAEGGWRLTAVAGEVQESAPLAAAPGTQVTVAELFFNTPARRKFLKSKDAEQAHIVEILRALALGYPQVHFSLKTAARTLLSAPATPHLKDRVAAVFGPELAGHLLPLELAQGPWQVTGLVTEPDFSLASARFQIFLVNHRVVQDRVLAGALKEVCTGLLPKGRHPGAVVALQLPPEEVDVNVHPAKTEVRFQDRGRVFALLLGALRQGLGPLYGAGGGYRVSFSPEPAPSPALWAAEPGLAPLLPGAPEPGTPFIPGAPPPGWGPLPEGPTKLAAGPGPRRFRFQDLTIIGQLQATYILAQSPEGLVLIDQHAAHERILYETLKARPMEAGRQSLLFPKVVEVSPAQADWVRANLAVLAQAGLTLSPFGGASFLLTAAPALLADADPEALVAEAVEELSPIKSGAHPQELRERMLLFMACRGAIKAGDPLQPQEIQALLIQLDEIPISHTCPHGRPFWRLIPFGDIHQSFRRPR